MILEGESQSTRRVIYAGAASSTTNSTDLPGIERGLQRLRTGDSRPETQHGRCTLYVTLWLPNHYLKKKHRAVFFVRLRPKN